MFDKSVISIVKQYVAVLMDHSIPVAYAVLFGSFARGEQHADSDVDLLVVSDAFDRDWHKWNRRLWELTAYSDAMIEPMPVTEDELASDDLSIRIEMARREGIVIYPDDTPPKRLDESEILVRTRGS